MIQDFERYTEDSDGVSNARVLVEAFDRHYYPYSDDQVAYALLELGGFKKFGDVLKEIKFCRVLEPYKRGRK